MGGALAREWPVVDPVAEIHALKRAKRAIVLAHYYQESDIQDVADVVGDSLALAQAAAKTDAAVIVFAGVHFMAETAKILNPGKKVVVPDLTAGCSLAESCPPEEFAKFKSGHPDHLVVSYINCTAAIKAMSDIICTSSNAEKIVRSIPAERGIIFAPDQHLGRYLMKKTGRPMVLWQGSCIVHEQFSVKALTELQMEHPGALIIAHPECQEAVLAIADFIGSTSSLIRFVQESKAQAFIVATETGILHQMRKVAPDKELIAAPGTDESCACNLCPHMKKNTLEKLYLCMRDETPEIVLDEPTRLAALRPLKRMLELSR